MLSLSIIMFCSRKDTNLSRITLVINLPTTRQAEEEEERSVGRKWGKYISNSEIKYERRKERKKMSAERKMK